MITDEIQMPSAPYTSFTSHTFGVCEVEYVAGYRYKITSAPDQRNVGVHIGLAHFPARAWSLSHGCVFREPARTEVYYGGGYSGACNVDPIAERADVAH